MELTTKQYVALTIALLLATLIIMLKAPTPASATGPFSTNIGPTATTSRQIAVTASTRILATTTNPIDATNSHTRVYASVCNPSATPVAISLNGDAQAASSSATSYIAAAAGYSVCYEITDTNQYQGSVQASSTVGQVYVNVQEFVNP